MLNICIYPYIYIKYKIHAWCTHLFEKSGRVLFKRFPENIAIWNGDWLIINSYVSTTTVGDDRRFWNSSIHSKKYSETIYGYVYGIWERAHIKILQSLQDLGLVYIAFTKAIVGVVRIGMAFLPIGPGRYRIRV